MPYRGPAMVSLTVDEWYVVYLMLLTANGAMAREIRGRVYEYLREQGHPGVADETDA